MLSSSHGRETIELRIKFQSNNGHWDVGVVQLYVRANSQELEIDEIYTHLNIFIEQHTIQDSMPMYKDKHGALHILRKDSELDVERHLTKPDRYFIDLILASGAQMAQIEKEIQRLSKEKDDLNRKIYQCEETIRSRMGGLTGEECDIAILYAEPIRQNSNNFPSSQPVTYEPEIQCIKNLLNKRKKLTLKSKVATLENLQQLLQKGVNVLHISCHGNLVDKTQMKKGDANTFLEFQSSGCEIGLFHKLMFEDLKNVFARVFQNESESTKTKHKPTIIILNACYSGNLAKLIWQKIGIPYTIGINAAYKIQNFASEKFTSKFYDLILNNEEIKHAFDQAKQYVRKEIIKSDRLICCCQTHSNNEYGCKECRKQCLCKGKSDHIISTLTSCQCPNRIFCSHRKGCDILSLEELKGQPAHERKGQIFLCCCSKIHDESEKFLINYNQSESRTKIPKRQQTDYIMTAEENYFPVEHKVEGIFYKQNIPFSKCIDTLSQRGNKVIIMTGHPGSGKTAYARKLLYYILERQNVNELILVNCKNFSSTLDIHLNFRLTRNRAQMNWDQMTRYLQDQTSKFTSFIVFDHCNQLIESSNQQVMSLITSLNQRLTHTKIIMILNKSQATQQLTKKYKGLIEIQDDAFKSAIETRYGKKLAVKEADSKRYRQLELTNMRDLLKELQSPQNMTFQILASNIRKKQEIQQKRTSLYKSILESLEQKKDIIESVIILSVFRAGIKFDQKEIFEDKMKINFEQLRTNEIIAEIVVEMNQLLLFKFADQWYDFVLQQHQLIQRYFKSICQVFYEYMNNYIIARIRKEPSFFLEEFQISPFQALPDSNKYQFKDLLTGETELTSENVKSFLSLTIRTNCKLDLGVYYSFRNCLIGVPLLMQLLHEENVSSYLHKCLNKMSIIEKEDKTNYDKGIMRLFFQLNRLLMTSGSNQSNFEQCLQVINKHLPLNENITDPILKVQKSILILQQKYYILQGTSENQLTEDFKKGIFYQIDNIDATHIESTDCKKRAYCYIGALVIKLIEKYQNVDGIISRLSQSPFKLENLISETKKLAQSHQKAVHLLRKVKIIQFNLLFYLLQFQKKNDIGQYQLLQNQVSEYQNILNKNHINLDANSNSNSEELNSIIKKIAEHISKKKESLVAILTSKPLGHIVKQKFGYNLDNLIRVEDRVAQNLFNQLSNLQKMIYIKTYILNQKNLKEVLDQGCLVQMMIVDVFIAKNNIHYIMLEQRNRVIKSIQLGEFVQKYSFKNISILILSGSNVNKLEELIRKEYKDMVVICIVKTQQFNHNEDVLYWKHNQMQIWNECNTHFLSLFCQTLAKQETTEQLSARYSNAFQVAKHKTYIKLIENCWMIHKETDIDQYVSIYREFFQSQIKGGWGDDDREEGQDYLAFSEGTVMKLFSASEKCEDRKDTNSIVNFDFNEDIYKVLQLLDKDIEIVNVFGPMLFLETVGYEIYKSLLRNGQKSITYLRNSDESGKSNFLKNFYSLPKFVIFHHKMVEINKETLAILKKFFLICNQTGRKVILLTDINVLETKEEIQKNLKFLNWNKIKSRQISLNNLTMWAYIYALKNLNVREDHILRLRDIIQEKHKHNKDPDKLIQEVEKKLKEVSKEQMKKSHSSYVRTESNITGSQTSIKRGVSHHQYQTCDEEEF